MLFLPFVPAHSYLSKDQPFPIRGPYLSYGPSNWSRELLASLPMSPSERDFGGAMMRWRGLVLLRVSILPPLPL